jgi:hypothetical protein
MPGCRGTPPGTVEHARVRAHLEGAHALVAARSPSLSGPQLERRGELLRWLREYIDAGRYPVNDVLAERTPIFIDRFGARCAMAALIERSGHAGLAQRIARTENLARIRALAGDAELTRWLETHGLSLAEAARIQPAYDNVVTTSWQPTASVLGTMQVGGTFGSGFDLLGGPAVRAGARLVSRTEGACDQCVWRSVAFMLEYARVFRLGTPSVNQLALLTTVELGQYGREHQPYVLGGVVGAFDEQRTPQLGLGGQVGFGWSTRGGVFPWFVEVVVGALWQTRGVGLRGGLNAGVVW